MKKVLLILIAFVAICSENANAQRYLPNMQGLEFKGGLVDGVKKPNNFYSSIALSRYTKHQDRWVFGLEYLQKEYEYKEIQIPKNQFTAEGGYYYMFLSDASKTIFTSIGASALVGYETSNWGNKLLYDGSTLKNNDAFLYGGALTFEIETYLSDRIILLLNARERVLWGSSIAKFHFQVGTGLKFIIN